MKPAATTMAATAARAPFSYLVIEDEQYVQVDQKTRRVAGAATTTHRHLDRLAAEDDERDPQGQGQQRQQQLAGAHPRDHRREQASEHGHSDGGEEDRGNYFERQRHTEEQREGGQQHGLAKDQEQRRRQRLAGEDRGRRRRRHEHRFE